MVTADDTTNNFDASTPRTVFIEYNIIDPPECTNILKSPQNGRKINTPNQICN
jgi:hypothetical protein